MTFEEAKKLLNNCRKDELREGCLDPSDSKIALLQYGIEATPTEQLCANINLAFMEVLKSMLDSGYITITKVEVEDCDCDVEPKEEEG